MRSPLARGRSANNTLFGCTLHTEMGGVKEIKQSRVAEEVTLRFWGKAPVRLASPQTSRGLNGSNQGRGR